MGDGESPCITAILHQRVVVEIRVPEMGTVQGRQ